MSWQVLSGTLELGLMYAILVIGVYLTFRILNYADLSVDGSFTLGAAIAAVLIFQGYNPWLATFVAFLGGCLAGIFTGVLHTKFNISPLLSGILTMTALYSINLRIMGRPNISLLGTRTIIKDFENISIFESHAVLILSIITVIFVGFIIYRFLLTEIGLALRATGDNELMIRSQGVNTDIMKILGLSLSNGLVALAGSYVAQFQQFADVSMGIGIIIAGLASVIIGEVLVGSSTVGRAVIAVICGAIFYRSIIAVVLQMGLVATDLKLFTAFIVILALVSPIIKNKFISHTYDVRGKGEDKKNAECS